MKKILLSTAIIFACTFDALAGGKGTIHETDTQIYVEYSDDAIQDNPEVVFDQTETEQVEEQKKQEENLLNQRRKQKYDSWAAELSVQKKKLEGLRMGENGGVFRNETE